MIEVHGYAIVSDDDRIADAAGRMPETLRSDADWAYFQEELDRSAVTVLGRLGHEAHRNPRRRRRIVVSSSASGLEERSDAWWWNPRDLPWNEVGRRVLPGGGRVAVPGGRRVFDLFLEIGFVAFHLSRAEGARIPDGVPLFSACAGGKRAEAVLAGRGMKAGKREILDPNGPISLTVWRR